ncbi:c-type cytochrome [Hydrogenophaga sp. PBL-H3]|uniref:c-type cytochrome n=1 Tax=Hydrogenophaga sp. PBL-H3 TaxID=434010 RepID=UPI00131FEDEE|nr:c-type cytochrome [Hydrogenophaga sp. PBL-H3]QHE77359.1 cytochrome c [Hydrogenophaga sp. PBL-H3]QHE81783.1 cytochrome c [Hydrogenophaga sp. PBL-H3]
MSGTTTPRWIALTVLLALAASVQAQSRSDPGRWDYQNSCASCHGASGRGDGPVVRYLVTPPTDLSRLAQRNGGVFPRDRLVTLIDGRASPAIGPHGSREMPIWGNTYVERFTQSGGSPQLAEDAALRRILDLVDHLERLQR